MTNYTNFLFVGSIGIGCYYITMMMMRPLDKYCNKFSLGIWPFGRKRFQSYVQVFWEIFLRWMKNSSFFSNFSTIFLLFVFRRCCWGGRGMMRSIACRPRRQTRRNGYGSLRECATQTGTGSLGQMTSASLSEFWGKFSFLQKIWAVFYFSLRIMLKKIFLKVIILIKVINLKNKINFLNV